MDDIKALALACENSTTLTMEPVDELIELGYNEIPTLDLVNLMLEEFTQGATFVDIPKIVFRHMLLYNKIDDSFKIFLRHDRTTLPNTWTKGMPIIMFWPCKVVVDCMMQIAWKHSVEKIMIVGCDPQHYRNITRSGYIAKNVEIARESVFDYVYGGDGQLPTVVFMRVRPVNWF